MPQTVLSLNPSIENELLTISKTENKSIVNLIEKAVIDFIDTYKETLELIGNKEFYKSIQKGKDEIRKGVKGKSLSELDN